MSGDEEPGMLVEVLDVRITHEDGATITITETSVISANAHIAQLLRDPGPVHL